VTVGHIREPVLHALRCWACGAGLTSQHNVRYGKWLQRIDMYERCVETAERLGWFSVAEIVEAVGRGPVAHTVARYAVRDLALHGMITCVQQGSTVSRHGKRSCYRWEFIDD
jgi:hypothetical protein